MFSLNRNHSIPCIIIKPHTTHNRVTLSRIYVYVRCTFQVSGIDRAQVSRSPLDYYYHYTSQESLGLIKRSGYLIPMSGDIGKGIYVTTLDPFNHSEIQLRQQLFNGSNSSCAISKLESFVALDKYDVIAACSVVQVYPGRHSCLQMVPMDDKLWLFDVKHYYGSRG